MFLRSIKRLVTVIFICACGLSAKSQQVHFVYLQTENGQPFYVKFNNKVFSSSAAGYLILAKLLDGDYTLNVGFPKNEFPEEGFQISINNKNEGFLLKNFNEKGWGLFNIENYNILMGTSNSTGSAPAASQNLQNDPFSKMLANVVKDSTILQKNEPEKPVAIVGQSAAPDLNKDTAVMAKADSLVNEKTLVETDTAADRSKANLIVKTDAEKVSEKEPTTAATGEHNLAAVGADGTKTEPLNEPEKQPLVLAPAKKYMSKKGSDGMEMIYVDPNENGNDTVRIFIPAEKNMVKQSNTNAVVHNESAVSPTLPDTSVSLKSDAVEQPNEISDKSNDTTASLPSPNFIENINSIKNKDSALGKKDEEVKPKIDRENSTVQPSESSNDFKKNNIVVLPQVIQSSASNSDCKAFASNEDFLRLRKKMASENNDDQMIKIAKKYFHTKCYSTEQIKNLSFLFLSNEGKYRFFDVAYPFSSDSEQYRTLQSQLTDSYYINRFKAMIHK